MQVRDVMTSTVISINADTPMNEALAVMQINKVSVLSVKREHECLGVLSEEDIHTQMSRRGMDPMVTTAGMLLNNAADREARGHTAVHSLCENTPISEALRTMVDNDLQYAAVYNEDSEMVGVVSQKDLEKPLLAETVC